ncbi:valine--tRNA ligase, partial [Methanosarcinales archaeon]
MPDAESSLVSKEYNALGVESRLVESWDESDYFFDWDSNDTDFVIDTPPPYPTGDFHIGNALNWCYIDFVARYKRLRGFNVMFPQGWDCHGLPTEVKVE